MKQNRLFLLSYVIFIFICAVVKCFLNYPLWSNIVVAITTSSWILAFADFYSSKSKQLNIIADEQHEYSDNALLEIKLIKESISKRLFQLENNSNEDVTDSIKYYSKAKEEILTLESEFNILNEDVSKGKSEAKTNENLATVCYIIGYLSLFCIIAFEPLTNILLVLLNK